MPITLLSSYDHYAYAVIAIFGTAVAVYVIDRLMGGARSGPWVHSLHGVVPPFINIVGVLFGLTVAFLANDTWSAHDRTTNAVYREADALRSIMVVTRQLEDGKREALRAAVIAYQAAAVEEWPLLARRTTSPAAATASDRLLALAATQPAQPGGAAIQTLLLGKAAELRADRDARISLSQAHVNPLKWLGMAFLGLVTLLSVAAVHAENRRAALVAMLLFALAAAPAAAIVLVQSNPFQPPATVSPRPIIEALAGLQ